MINEVISAICKALYDYFGDEYEIYKESIEQGLNEPCFFVQCISPISQDEIIDRKHKDYSFIVQYFPQTKSYEEINNITDDLDEVLNLIHTDRFTLRASDVSPRTIDKVLNYEITYDFRVIDIAPEENMEDLEIESGVKNG